MPTQQVERRLNPQRQIFSVIGNIANNPTFVRELEDPIQEKDFILAFHKTAFNAISNIVYENPSIKSVDALDIDNYLKQYPKYYEIWSQNNGVDFIGEAKQAAKEELFDNDVSIVKKYSLLRTYIDNGIDISDLYDYTSSDMDILNQSAETISKMTFTDIIEHYTNKIINIRNDVNENNGQIIKFDINDGIDTLLDRLQESPEMGYPFVNGYYNGLFRGMRTTKFMLRSGDTGTGKTRQAMKDMCNISCAERYETGKGWVSTGPSLPILFISTELNKEELQILALAYVSGIGTSDIENGDYDKTARMRLERAVQVIKSSNMHFVFIDDFSVNDIQLLIEEHVINFGIKYCVFDYIQNAAKLSRTLQESFGHVLREDEVLYNLSRRLKAMAEKYDVFVMSSTQLNGKAKEENTSLSRDANVLRGGRSVADKIDYGVLTFRVTPNDKKNLQNIIQTAGFGKEPNFAHWVYKNRAGMDHVVVWSHMDLGTMREEPLFITDYDYNLVDNVSYIEAEVSEDDSASTESKLDF